MQNKQFQMPIKCDEAIKCIFNLNTLDINIYKKLKQIGPTQAKNLANHLNKERSTVYRSLQKLTNCGICKKKVKTLPQGGYYHIYHCCSIEHLRRNAEECLEKWYSDLKNTLNSLKD